LHHLDFSFRLLSSLFFSSSLYPHLHSSHFLETLHVHRFTPLFEVDQRAPLVGRPGPAWSHGLSTLEYHG
jgi:hypothetical protein